jgi:hypothetical protein
MKRTPHGLFSPRTFDRTVEHMNHACERAFDLRREAKARSILGRALLRLHAWRIERDAFEKARLIAGEQHRYGEQYLARLSPLDQFQIHRLFRDYGKPGERHLAELDHMRQAA